MKKILAIDGNSILNRAFYGIRYLSNSKGVPTNAVFGFLNILSKTLKEVKPDYIVCAFDMSGPTFRHRKYEKYKANRHGMPNELALQLPLAKKMLNLLGIKIVEIEGFEGDDILGTIRKIAKKNKLKCIIASGDRDCLQLVDEDTLVRLATNKETKEFDSMAVMNEYGVSPCELIDIKALMGDSSDNIPGVDGIGQKTAIELIKKYHSIDGVFNNLENITGRGKKLLGNDGAKEAAYLSYELGKISDKAPIDENIEVYLQSKIDKEELEEFFDTLEFKNYESKLSFIKSNKMSLQKESSPTIKDADPDMVEAKLQKEEKIVFLWNDTLLIFACGEVYEFTQDTQKFFERFILNSKKEKWTNNLKEMYHRADIIGKELKEVTASAEISGYLLDVLAKSYTLDDLRRIYYRKGMLPGCFVDIMKAMEKKIQKENMRFLEKEIELPLCRVLCDMEKEGFAIDEAGLKRWGVQFKGDIEKIGREIIEMAGEEFNINSPKEVGLILFEKLGLPPQRKTKIGYSTDAEVLSKLVKYHPIAKKILEYRTLTKLKSTYVEGLLKNVSKDGRVHSIFKQTETRTGRISSSEPNMQNIPVRTEFSSTFRKFFVAPKSRILIDADYSQIELRILANLSKDEKMIDAFLNGIDIHLVTAAQVFSLDPILVPPELRRRAKIINFSIIYGAGPYSLSQDLGVGVKEAKDYIDRYFETYSGVKEYLDEVVEKAKRNGYTKTMFGRVRKIPEFKDKNFRTREFAQRAAKNTTIQGSAADIIKIAMVRVSNRLKEEGLKAKLILQVHDELLIESSKEDAKRAAFVLKEEMEGAAKLDIPLIAHVTMGKNWYDAKT